MWNLNNVTQLRYSGGYRYQIIFDDGISGEVDFAEYLDTGSVFAPLRDLEFFQQARIEGGTIAWPNGADIAPESLYDKVSALMTEAHPEQRAKRGRQEKFQKAMTKVADVEPEERDKR